MSEQADRLEAKIDQLIALLEQSLAQTVSVEKLQPLDPAVWPDWYQDLYSLPNFRKPLEECQQWLSEKNIIGVRADETAAYIRGVWPGPKKWKQPWAVFRNLIQRRPQGANYGITGQHLPANPEESGQTDRARTERLASRRAEVSEVSGANLD